MARKKVIINDNELTPTVLYTKKKRRGGLIWLVLMFVAFIYVVLNLPDIVNYIKYFKRLVNPDLFVEHRYDKYLGEIEVLRSSRDLDTGDMTTAIERFRNWSASEADIYLPAPNEQEFLDSIEREMQCRRIWL